MSAIDPKFQIFFILLMKYNDELHLNDVRITILTFNFNHYSLYNFEYILNFKLVQLFLVSYQLIFLIFLHDMFS